MSQNHPKGFIENIKAHWIHYIGAVILLSFMTAAIIYLPCPSSTQYIFSRIAITLAGGLIALAFVGIIEVKSTGIRATGCFAVMITIFFGMPAVLSDKDKCHLAFDFTIYLQDTLGNIQKKSIGYLTLQIKNHPDRREIDIRKGTVDFGKIPEEFRNTVATLRLELDEWQFTNGKNIKDIKLDSESLTVFIQRDSSLCCFEGTVIDSLYNPIANAQLSVGDEIRISDSNGRFRFVIPFAHQSEHYKIIARKNGFINKVQNADPSTDFPVMMYREEPN